MAKYFLINVPGKRGYSIPIKTSDREDEDSVIDLAKDYDLFEGKIDADYAGAVDVTDDAQAIASYNFFDAYPEHLFDCE